jgi:serine protease AprX
VRTSELGALAAEPGVTRIARDGRMAQTGKTPTPTGLVNYTNLTTLYPTDDDVQRSWDSGYDGRGVGIAIIDSGVAALPDFGSRLTQVQLSGRTETVTDTIGHGTLVAAIAAGQSTDGRFIGIAPRASIYGINVSRGKQIYSSDVISGLQWVLDNAHTYNIRVVNLSMTETTPSSYKDSLLDLAVERVWASGTMVVVAAGNTGNSTPADYAPANDPLAFTVGGMDDKGTLRLSDDVVASYSAGGLIGSTTTMDGFPKPEILASGRLIESTPGTGTDLALEAPTANRIGTSGYVRISGTSFAAPQVAGAAALLFQQHPDWSPDAVKFTLSDRARIVQSGTIVQLDVGAAVNISTPAGLANQGVPALVCAPGTICLDGTTTIASYWSSASWSSASWSSASWSSASWSSASWSSASWSSASWSSASWSGTGDWSYMSWS